MYFCQPAKPTVFYRKFLKIFKKLLFKKENERREKNSIARMERERGEGKKTGRKEKWSWEEEERGVRSSRERRERKAFQQQG